LDSLKGQFDSVTAAGKTTADNVAAAMQGATSKIGDGIKAIKPGDFAIDKMFPELFAGKAMPDIKGPNVLPGKAAPIPAPKVSMADFGIPKTPAIKMEDFAPKGFAEVSDAIEKATKTLGKMTREVEAVQQAFAAGQVGAVAAKKAIEEAVTKTTAAIQAQAN